MPVQRSSVNQKLFQIVRVEHNTDLYGDVYIILKSVIVVALFAET